MAYNMFIVPIVFSINSISVPGGRTRYGIIRIKPGLSGVRQSCYSAFYERFFDIPIDFISREDRFSSKSNTDDKDQTDFHGSVRIRVIRAIRVLFHDFSLNR